MSQTTLHPAQRFQPVWHGAHVCLILCAVQVAVFFVVETHSQVNRTQRTSASEDFYAVSILVYRNHTDVQGPFKLWDKGPGLIPLAMLHHAGELRRNRIIQLCFDVLLLLTLGAAVERRIGWWKMLLLIVFSGCISLSVEYLVLVAKIEVATSGGATVLPAQGTTGVVFACFGVLMVLRREDIDLRIRLKDDYARGLFFLLMLLLGVRIFGPRPWPVIGWMFGLSSGVIFASAMCLTMETRKRQWTAQFVAGMFAAGAVLMMQAAAAPEWLGEYHAWQGMEEKQDPKRAGHFREAVKRDPSMKQVWHLLIDLNMKLKRRTEAWETAIRAVSHHRANQKFIEKAHGAWRSLKDSERITAREKLRELFDHETGAWEKKLIPPDTWFDRIWRSRARAEDFSRPFAPHVDPHDPATASEGVALE